MVRGGVVEHDGAAVDGLDGIALGGVFGSDPGAQVVVDPPVRGVEELDRQAFRAPAVGAGILAGHRQAGVVAPRLDEAHGLAEQGVGLEGPGEPGPEGHDVAILADSLRDESP